LSGSPYKNLLEGQGKKKKRVTDEEKERKDRSTGEYSESAKRGRFFTAINNAKVVRVSQEETCISGLQPCA
jgi:hypothetical protein